MRTKTLLFTFAALGLCALGANETQAQATVNNGTFTLNLTITLTTAVPEGGTVECSLTVSDDSATYAVANVETATAPAEVTGGTATCVVNLPYRWYPANAATDHISYSYSASIIPTGSTTPTTAQFRTGTHTLPGTTGVPPANTHTILTESTRL